VVGYCFAPRTRAPVYSRAVASNSIALSAITRVAFTWDGYEIPEAIPHQATPALSSLEELADGALSGTLSGASPDYEVSLLTINFYLRGADGLLFERLYATRSEPLDNGMSWEFRSNAPSRAATTFVQTLRFAAR
jgi:hypothetical protein